MDVFDHLKNQKPSNSRIQDSRRRMNQRPAIKRAQVTAEDGVGRGRTAQQRADEAHSRFTNAALDSAHTRADNAHFRESNGSLDNAHTKAEARVPKDGSEPALFLLTNANVGTGAVTIVKHTPADDDEVVMGHADGGILFFRNNTTAKELLILNRTGHASIPSGNLDVQGRMTSGAITAQFDGNIANLVATTGGVTYTHNFTTFPSSVFAYQVIGRNAAGEVSNIRPLPRDGCFVSSVTRTQITILNEGATAKEVGVYLIKG